MFRATYCRQMKAKDILQELGYTVFVPTVYKRCKVRDPEKKGEWKVVRMRRPVSSYLFIRVTSGEAQEVLNQPKLFYLRLAYNHLEGRERGTENPIIISDAEMENFVRVVGVDDLYVTEVDGKKVKVKSSRRVRVTGGPFEGAEGVLVRYKGVQRVMASLGNLNINVASSFIPNQFIQYLDEK